MKKEVTIGIIEAGIGVVGMVFIYRLVQSALMMGIDGVYFFIGVAAIAGLGGYEVRWLIDIIRARSKQKKENNKTADS